MANIVTGCRILGSILLLCVPAFSPGFWVLYLICGFTDMIDGAIARKTNTVSSFGAKLDTAADFLFVWICLVKLLPAVDIPGWLWIWITGIAVMKILNAVSGFVRMKRFTAEHTMMNKVTGALLFLLPMTRPLVELKYIAAVVRCIATFAAVQEGHLIRAGRQITSYGGSCPNNEKASFGTGEAFFRGRGHGF